MVAGFVLAAFVSAAAPQTQVPASGEVRGVVHGQWDRNRAPLAAALIEITVDGVHRSAVADKTGTYVLSDVPSGFGRIRVVHVGHDVLEADVLVPPNGVLALDVELRRHPVSLEAVEVVVDRTDPEQEANAPDAGIGLAEVDLRALAGGTGIAESGIVDIARATAGDDPGDARNVLFMRGATTDLKLVLLDGAPVYAPFHVGGLIPTFDMNLIGGATHYVGAAPARYDGGLSYILDLNTRRPGREGVHSSGALDLISARASVTGPLGSRGGFLLGGRALHPGVGQLYSDAARPYGYGDALAKLEFDVAPGHRLTGMGFLNRESVFLDLPGSVDSSERDRGANWGNRAFSLSYQGDFGSSSLMVRTAVGLYEASLPISRRSGDLYAHGASGRARLTVDASTPFGAAKLLYGASVEQVETTYTGRQLGGSGAVLLEDAAQGIVSGGYVEARIPVSKRVQVWAGARLDRFSSDGSVRPAPRLKLAWFLSDEAVLSVAAGRYHQYARISEEGVEGALGGLVDDGSGLTFTTPLLSVATASHLVVSLDQLLLPTVRIGIDGYLKTFEGVSGPGQRMNASGGDIRVQHVGAPVTVWLGYSLAWFWSDDGLGQTTEQFVGQQLLSAGISGRAWNRLGLDLRLGYGDGLPLTAVQLGDAVSLPAATGLEGVGMADAARGSAPLWSGASADEFLRLDAEVSGLFETQFGTHPVIFRPYLKVMNALGRRDALFYYFEPWRSEELQPLVESTFLPIVGFEWRF